MLVQAAYNAIPYALSPVLGNPLAMAAVNVDRSASLPTQVSNPSAISLGADILQNIHKQNEVMPLGYVAAVQRSVASASALICIRTPVNLTRGPADITLQQ